MSAERRAPSPLPIHLLLIDNSQDDHHLIRDLLDDVADVSFAIDWAKDLLTGRDLLEHGRFDICLIDHQLPDGDGLALIETARIRGSHPPIIILANRESVELDRRAMALGASGFLNKDRLDPTLLERTIRYAMQQRKVVHNLDEAALRDDTTGLITPILFRDRLARALAAAKRHQTMAALVLIDLGHDDASTTMQEQHLIDQAKRLTDQLRETDTVARLANDRLGLILEGLRGADDAALVTQKILDNWTAPKGLEDNNLNARPFAGIALYPEDCGDISALLRQAEAAMRRAKTNKTDTRPTYRFGSKRPDQNVQRTFLLSDDLKRALDQQALALRYRPLVHVADKAISLSVEMYSNRQNHQPISRDQFQSIADDRPLIEELTNWFVGEATTQLLTWQSQGFERINLSLPFISARPDDLPILERSIRQHLGNASIAPDQLEIDLDQKIVLGDLERGGHGLMALKETGIRLALDEFGCDDTNLHKLAHNLLDGLKLSSRLYHDLPGNAANETLLEAIINLGHDLDLHVVANGARDEHQFAFLKSAGCDAIKLCAADSLMTASMLTTWLQESKPSIVSEKASAIVNARVASGDRQPGQVTMKMDTKQSLSSLDTQ